MPELLIVINSFSGNLSEHIPSMLQKAEIVTEIFTPTS